ncbi:MAG: fumarate hydratase [Planctomycetes bacterium]|nr:fumarate hydratase [Planctomycetota bacterium]
MREIKTDIITSTIKKICMDAAYFIPEEVQQALKDSIKKEESTVGKEVLAQLVKNNELARNKQMPICQDTGTAVIFIELGQDVCLKGGYLYDAINEGVRQGYTEGYLRKSITIDPLNRKNTGDNTPAVIHTELVPGEKLKITFIAKGGGSENMGKLIMLPPSAGIAGVKKFVVETIKTAGSNPCPPIVVGIGIGSTFDGVAVLAKRALLRPLGTANPDPYYAKLEQELLTDINNTGIGPSGLGGRITALAVHIERASCHITALPVAVNLNCHAARYKTITI